MIERAIEEAVARVEREYTFELSEMEVKDLANYIEHTNLRPTATFAEIEKLVEEALENGFFGVCVNPCYVSFVAEKLRGTDVKVVTVVGFPLGATSSESKAAEASFAVKEGAQEVDMVINVGFLKSQEWEKVYDDVKAVVDASGVPVKVIIETAYLTRDEKIAACVISKLAGASFVKTSTGFAPFGATAEDVHLMKFVVGEEIGVKASGGIRTREDAIRMIRAGASRIGTSSGVAILRG